jgi:23S rRNA (cytosine1962-C5)-methyltransferase
MITLPQITPARIAVTLKPAAERMVKKGHPWVFAESILKQNATAKAGDLAIIYDGKNNKFLACGLYDPDSAIRIKILQVHTSATIDDSWFEAAIAKAFAIRLPLLDSQTNSYRLLFGENDGLPGVVADVYANILVVKLYSAAWFPYLQYILPLLVVASKAEVVVLRLSRSLQSTGNEYGLHDGQVLHGTLKGQSVIFKEHGLLFTANVIDGHKTGYFLDHRANRAYIGSIAKHKSVLDIFAYAGGFSVHALAGGAREVTSVDISDQALQMAKKNAALNPHTGTHITVAADAFDVLDQLITTGKTYDIVVIDPPSFAKKEAEVHRAKQTYRRLIALSIQLVAKHGTLLLASCSSRITSDVFFSLCQECIDNSGIAFALHKKTYHDIDHPITFLEGAYLKAVYYKRVN